MNLLEENTGEKPFLIVLGDDISDIHQKHR
jgi:hypothetical protein